MTLNDLVRSNAYAVTDNRKVLLRAQRSVYDNLLTWLHRVISDAQYVLSICQLMTWLLHTGRCHCQHNTAGDHCDRCVSGYYGSPIDATPDDCQPCPCPHGSSCLQLLDGQVACFDCPAGHIGTCACRYLALQALLVHYHLLTVSASFYSSRSELRFTCNMTRILYLLTYPVCCNHSACPSLSIPHCVCI